MNYKEIDITERIKEKLKYSRIKFSIPKEGEKYITRKLKTRVDETNPYSDYVIDDIIKELVYWFAEEYFSIVRIYSSAPLMDNVLYSFDRHFFINYFEGN